MKKYIFLFVFLIFNCTTYAQTKSPLSKLLWENVETCFSNFRDLDEEDKKGLEIIDDTKNGYLEVCGTYPTCGCYCSSYAGAYKDLNNNYTILQSNEVPCNWTKSTSSNKELATILPNHFGLRTFSSAQIIPQLANPAFYFNFTIPRKGTDTRVNIELIPFGLNIKGTGAWLYSYNENLGKPKSITSIQSIANSIKDDKTLDYLISGSLDSIAPIDLKIIKANSTTDNISSTKELGKTLEELKKIYTAYLTIEHAYIILSWDKENAVFIIKEKGEKPASKSFKTFLLQGSYWAAMC